METKTESSVIKPSTESPSVPCENPNEIILKQLDAIVFLSDPSQVSRKGLKDMRGIYADNFPELKSKKFQKLMQEFFYRPFTIATSRRLVSKVANFYREYDSSIVSVLLPDQNISYGVIQILILKGKAGNLTVSGNQWTSAENVLGEIHLKKGDVISQEKLSDDITWLNRNPFQRIDAVFAPGKATGLTDVDFRVKDRFPVRPYAGYENTGNDLTGDERWYAGLNWGNAFGVPNHLFSYQFTTSSDFEMSLSHAATYTIPLPWRHLIGVFGSRTDTEADVLAPLALKGKSWNVGARYIMPFRKVEIGDDILMNHEAEVGFDFKQSDSNLEFGGVPITNTSTDINQFTGKYTMTFQDPHGYTSLVGSIFHSPGGWTDNSKDPKYQAARALTEAQYTYAQAEAIRSFTLPWDFSTFHSFTWQWSDGNLLSSEQLGFGGRDSIRGYEEREVNADEGWIMRHEFRSPPVSFADFFDSKDVNDQLYFLGFWDYGVAKNNRLLPGENIDTELSSVGPGVRYTINPYLSAVADYGFQLINSGNNNRFASRLHLGITLSY
ncbi:MAG: ShlB/FhaC/HecB family hemolysin secretion/activation protein [Verrucomicrobiota bacterium]